MDRTLINLASLLLGGAGLFTVMTGFNVPETTSSYWGENPFAIKRDAIETRMDWIFSGVALIALLLQAGAEIFADQVPQSVHSHVFYFWFAFAGLLFVTGLVWALSAVGRHVARRTWVPRVISAQNDLVQSAASIIGNDGFSDEELPAVVGYTPSKTGERRVANFEEAERHIAQIEKLFEIERTGDLLERADRANRVVEKLRRRHPARPLR